ncbi:MAG: FAD-dependent oxidoreductase [Desulfomonile tiedjei]|uniref:dihydrouracil dehydrogenase (NAD(+)) n=1 Tax=Desulfomonile tiedjei TaxID=2358 RepID=A0A9D6V3Q9_9BACT|nr:FAD-dependent oxidoreductase [Desulfomonile tiedjei]
MSIRVRLNHLEDYPLKVPCREACPVHTDAGNYVRAIAGGVYEEAYRLARRPNPLASVCARVCAAPCEDKCRRGTIDSPITIRALKRFVCEKHEASLPPECHPPRPEDAVASFDDKVAIIGGGPAGMGCADTLLGLGYRVTLFEATEMAGGALWQFIPEYRLPRSVLDVEVCALLERGLDLRLETPLNDKVTLSSLREQGYKAFFLACGATRGLDLAIEGRDADGIFRAVDYLLNVNRGYRIDLGKKVVAIGGGSVAVDVARTALRPAYREGAQVFPSTEEGLAGLDAARSALRGGAESVTMVSLESLEELPAARSHQGKEELAEALREGVKLEAGLGPKRILVENGKVVGVEFMQVDRLFDEDGRFHPTFSPGTESKLEADAVILAIGQSPELSFLKEEDGIELTSRGTIKVDPATMATTAPGIFAGGDVAFGPRIIIDAVANGKRAAYSIDRFLRGVSLRECRNVVVEELNPEIFRRDPHYDVINRETPPLESSDRRIGPTEVEKVYDEYTARNQALRCLDCYIHTIYDPELCILCGRCTSICPTRCITFVSADLLESENEPTRTFLATQLTQEKTALIKDEDLCIRCGLCAHVCPTNAMTLERFQVEEQILCNQEGTL